MKLIFTISAALLFSINSMAQTVTINNQGLYDTTEEVDTFHDYDEEEYNGYNDEDCELVGGFVFASNFYSPNISTSDKEFKSDISGSFFSLLIMEKLTENIYLGGKLSLFDFNWTRFASNEAGIDKRRYFEWSTAIYLNTRFVLTKTKDQDGLFFDIGVGYKLPVLLSYSEFKKHETEVVSETHRKIHNFNNFNATAAIGYKNISIIASYRIIEDNLEGNYIEKPRLNIGLAYNFGFSDSEDCEDCSGGCHNDTNETL